MNVRVFKRDGCERPKCLGETKSRPIGEHLRFWDGGCSGYYLTMIQDHAVQSADKWWLVYCEAADHGRAIIGADECGVGPRRETGETADDVLRSGRIVATGENGR